MAQNDGSVIIKVDLNLEDFNKTEKESEKLASNLTKNFSKAGTSVANGIKTAFDVTLKAIAATSAAVTAVSAIGINYNMQMENYLADFTVMLGSTEKAVDHVEQLKEMAAKTPFEMTDLAQADKILLAFGSTAETVQEQLQMLGDISLGNSEKLNTIATAFGRIQSNGRASMEELNMMIDAGFNPLNIIAKETGETMEEVRKRVSEGGVSYEEIAEAMKKATSAGGQFYKGMEVASKTASGQISTLQDNVNALLGDLTEGLFEGLKNDLIPRVNDAVEQIHTAFNEGGTEAAFDTAADILKSFIGEIAAKAPGAFSNLITNILPMIKETGQTIILSLVEAILGTDISKKLASLFDGMDEAFEGLVDVIAENSDEIITVIGDIINIILEIAEVALPLFIDGISWLIKHLDDFAPLLITAAGGFAAFKTAEGVHRIVSNVSDAFKSLGSVFAAHPILGTITAIVGAFSAIVSLDRAVSSRIEEDAKAFAKLSDEQQEAIDRSKEYVESWNEVKKISSDKSKAATAEYSYYQQLSNELKTIVDSEGNIIRGYEERANVITTTLSDALGIEIEMVDGQILGYKNLQTEIDKTIEKKLAEAKVNAYVDQYNEALQNRNQLEKDYLTNLDTLKEKQEQRTELQDAYNEAQRQWIEQGYVEEELMQEIGGDWETARARMEALDATIEEATEAVQSSEEAFLENKSTLELYGEAMAALERGEMSRFNDAILMLEDSMLTAETATEDSLKRQAEEQAEILSQMEQSMKDGSLAITQAEIDEQKRRLLLAEREYEKAANAAQKGAKNSAKKYADGIKEGEGPVSEAIGEYNIILKNKADVDLKPKGRSTGKSYASGIKESKGAASEAMEGVTDDVVDAADISLKDKGKKAIETLAAGIEAAVEKLKDAMKKIRNITGGTVNLDYSFSNPTGPGSEGVYSINYSAVDIPHLAKGAVIPPAAPFLAVLGDQSRSVGTNIEAPLETIKQAVSDVLNGSGGSREIHVHLNLSGRQIYEVIVDENESNTIATGVNALA